MPVIVQWPGINLSQCDIMHVLVLSGLAFSNRKSKTYLKSGYVYLDGEPVLSMNALMNLDQPYTLEVRYPNGIIKSMYLMVVERKFQ